VNNILIAIVAFLVGAVATFFAVGGGGDSGEASGGVSPQKMTDAVHMVLESDRTVYTKQIVNRLAQEEKVITASEHWKDEKALLLPAQMFRYGSELVQKKTGDFSYALLSLWPINAQNKPKTEVEKEGLEMVAKNPKQPFYKEETLGNKRYFTAVYADVAISPACVTCHNEHKDSPKTDFELNDVMGGVVIRIPL
jgi:hypothetical protein